MFEAVNGYRGTEQGPVYFRNVFLFGPEGVPLWGDKIVNRFVNFQDEPLFGWLANHSEKGLSAIEGVCLPLYGDWAENFWHWFNEALPVALAAHQDGFSGTYLVPDRDFAVESLQLIGVQPDRIRRYDGSDYHLECMCIQAKKQGGYGFADLEGLAAIRSIFRSRFVDSSLSHRIYISRNNNPANMRKVTNEEELKELLSRYGFVTLVMEELTLAQQLSYACNAEALLGPHGAGMTHSLFMPTRSLVVEMFAPTYINPCALSACDMLKHRYHQVTSLRHYGEYEHGYDIKAFIPVLELTLRGALQDDSGGAL